MDTDELSRKAYKGILVEADKFAPDLTLHFGLLADECMDETEYLVKCRILIEELKDVDPEFYPDVFFGETPDPIKLHQTLDRMLRNIDKMEEFL